MIISWLLILRKKLSFSTLSFEAVSIIDNVSKLWFSGSKPSNLVYYTNKILSDIVFSAKEIGKVILGLDPIKLMGYD